MTALFIQCNDLAAHVLQTNFPDGKISEKSLYGIFLKRILQRKTNRWATRGHKYRALYKAVLKNDTKRRHGRWLNETQCLEFNNFVTKLVRENLNRVIATHILYDPCFARAAAHARKDLNIPEEVYSADALSRDYTRWRIKNGGPGIYRKKSVAHLSDSEKAA